MDNDEDEALFIKEALKKNNLPVQINCAYSTAELYKQLEGDLPDLVLLDVQLPGQTGLECLLQLRQNEKYFDLPIIMVTNQHYRAHEMEALAAGAKRFVIKPTLMENYERLVDYLYGYKLDETTVDNENFILHFEEV